MRIGAVTPCFNDEATISGTIKCLAPFVDRHVVLISEKPYYGEDEEPDRSEEICNNLGVDVVKGVWELDNYQRNLGISMCRDMDWVLTLDSDEMFTSDEMDKFLGFLSETKVRAVAVRPIVYWKDTDHILEPRPEFTPIVAVNPMVKFMHIRNVDHGGAIWIGGDMHHLSWCAPKDIYKKVIHYAHAPDFCGETWYVKHYEPWVEGDLAVLPDRMYKVVKQPLPDELKQLL